MPMKVYRSGSSVRSILQVNRHTVRLWRKRFAEPGLKSAGEVAPGRGCKPIFGAEKVKAVVEATLQTRRLIADR